MNHNKSYRKLGRRSDHRKAMLKNLTISLVEHERIETTVPRAKELRKFAERMITLGKKGSLHDRRRAFAFLRNDEAIYKIFSDLADRYKDKDIPMVTEPQVFTLIKEDDGWKVVLGWKE